MIFRLFRSSWQPSISLPKTVPFILVFCLSACSADRDYEASQTAKAAATQAAGNGSTHNFQPAADADDARHHYYFDVTNHSKHEVHSLLLRAQEIYDSLPAEQRQSLKVAMVLHGPDLEYFAKRNYAKHKDLVDTAAKLEAFGFIDLKVCAVSARSHGVEEDGFPPFIDIVPFGPGEIRELERQGYTKL